jgi:hypothetical protein
MDRDKHQNNKMFSNHSDLSINQKVKLTRHPPFMCSSTSKLPTLNQIGSKMLAVIPSMEILTPIVPSQM